MERGTREGQAGSQVAGPSPTPPHTTQSLEAATGLTPGPRTTVGRPLGPGSCSEGWQGQGRRAEGGAVQHGYRGAEPGDP